MKPVVLDVTRTLSPKSIATPTGIDRVERAYIRYFLASDRDVLFLCRLGQGQALLHRSAMAALMDRVTNGTIGQAQGMVAKLAGPHKAIRRIVRQHAAVSGSAGDVAGSFPDGATYINVGHTNLEARTLEPVAAKARVVGMVHDMIPLDLPAMQTPASVTTFKDRMTVLGKVADTIIANSEATAGRVAYWWNKWGYSTPIIPIHLGVEPPLGVAPTTFDRPHFVQIGTIEPRKNHGFLLDIWDRLAAEQGPACPYLHVIGRRGWMSDTVLARLDTASAAGGPVIYHDALGDGETEGLLAGARALLFPSYAEGYGFPLLEATRLGVPSIVSDIEVFQELAPDLSLYIKALDATKWEKAIKDCLVNSDRSGVPDTDRQSRVPQWDRHFECLEGVLDGTGHGRG